MVYITLITKGKRLKSLNKAYISKIKFGSEHLAMLKRLGEYRGKQELFSRKSPEALETLKQHAVIESVESSNRLEQITAPRERIKGLVAESTKPRDRSEQEIAGYRDALELVHDSFEWMDINSNVILQIHSILYKYHPEDGGKFKSSDNEIVERDADGNITKVRFKPTPAIQTEDAMKELCAFYNDNIDDGNIDRLLVLPLMILDFLCIHPFKDGNGRVSRLLTLLILHRGGYEVGRYISLERIFEQQKEGYYENLEKSSQGWHEGEHDPFPWLNYFWGVLISAYKEFEEKVEVINESHSGKGSKTEQIKLFINKRFKPFAVSDIEKECPSISKDMIRNVLRQMRDDDIIESVGTGRGAKWIKKKVN